jgi:photosystem II stability/assembly factor-like uncharacterized protein
MPDPGRSLHDLIEASLRPVDVDAIVATRRSRRARRRAALGLLLVALVVGAATAVALRPRSPRTTHVEAAAPPSRAVPTSVRPSTRVTAEMFKAVSASFVSSERGWLLETAGRRFRVLRTNDGGATWKVVSATDGAIASRDTSPRIRFADESLGFVYGGDEIFATRDGGGYWTRLATPFASIQALEVARGTVDVIAWYRNGRPFGPWLWSTPVAHVAWHVEPVLLPVGAGPVPEQQLVLTHGAGWILNQDRMMGRGARRPKDGPWTTWQPECQGSGTITASSASDVVVSCTEGLWTGPRVTKTLDFSHDGGVTFARRTAPTAGDVMSPDARTAVVADGSTVRRTSDEGHTWRVVYHVVNGSDQVLDLGFTTDTQGFIVYRDSGLLMTYDAGATWTHPTP